jgi:hypothetical protein
VEEGNDDDDVDELVEAEDDFDEAEDDFDEAEDDFDEADDDFSKASIAATNVGDGGISTSVFPDGFDGGGECCRSCADTERVTRFVGTDVVERGGCFLLVVVFDLLGGLFELHALHCRCIFSLMRVQVRQVHTD